MLSKMMLPTAAKYYSIYNNQPAVPSTTNPSTILNETTDTPNSNVPNNKKKSNNSNWEKYKDIVIKPVKGHKSSAKRHYNNSGSFNQDKKKAKRQFHLMGANVRHLRFS